jgi:hypothetical protein
MVAEAAVPEGDGVAAALSLLMLRVETGDGELR